MRLGSFALLLVVPIVTACRPMQPRAPESPARSVATASPASPASPASTSAPTRPARSQADVDFMTAMIAHHQQAVVMVAMIADRTSSQNIRLLGLRIELSQIDEITLMKNWLRARGEPVPGEGEHADHEMPSQHDGHLMPGMLTPAQINALRAARGTEFDRRFLQFMIQHHEGAISMVAALFSSADGGQQAEIYGFASDVDADQQMEIARMRRLLAELP